MRFVKELFAVEAGQSIIARTRSGQSLRLLLITGCVVGVVCAFIYGFSMGISISLNSAWKDGVKVVIVLAGTYCITILPFILIFKVAERSVQPFVIALSMLLGWLMTSFVLAVTAPFCFLAGILWENGGKVVHIVVVDIAVLFGLYIAGLHFYQSAEALDRRKLAMPAAVGVALILLAVFLLVGFMSPFFEESPYFSQGTAKLTEIFAR